MVFPADTWAQATPESQGVDAAGLRAALEHLDRALRDFGGVGTVFIVRNGYAIWAGPESDKEYPIFSCTKVFTSTVLGVLTDDGKCCLEDLAIRYLPELSQAHPEYAGLRLHHLATMAGGYQGVVREVSDEQPWGDPLGYLLAQYPRYEPGSACAYHDHDVFLLGHILTRVAGESLAILFKRRIADPIGMTRWSWGVVGTLESGLPLNNVAGTPSRSPGVQTNARELARFGHLFLNRGLWDGRRLLSASFIDQATSNQVPASLPHASGADPAGHYGFYWWTNGRQRNGAQPWPDAPAGAYAARGGSGNFCFVVPDWNLVLVRLGTNTLTRSAGTDELWSGFFRQVREAMVQQAP
jgi:CubicO group peptidase (beta-lactamase class C family)